MGHNYAKLTTAIESYHTLKKMQLILIFKAIDYVVSPTKAISTRKFKNETSLKIKKVILGNQ